MILGRVYPEEADLCVTKAEQLLSTNVKVVYVSSVRIKCKIEDDQVIQYQERRIESMNANL